MEKAHTLDLTYEVDLTNDKKLFALSENGLRIRASQGHSVSGTELKLERETPSEIIFHGTVAASLERIRANGLQKQSQHHVHHSPDQKNATQVDSRRGKPIILRATDATLHRDCHKFYRYANRVWLFDAVPPTYPTFPE